MTIFNLFQLCCVIILIVVNIYYCKTYISVRKEFVNNRGEALFLLVMFAIIHLFPLLLLYVTINWFLYSMGITINLKQYWDAFINFKII